MVLEVHGGSGVVWGGSGRFWGGLEGSRGFWGGLGGSWGFWGGSGRFCSGLGGSLGFLIWGGFCEWLPVDQLLQLPALLLVLLQLQPPLLALLLGRHQALQQPALSHGFGLDTGRENKREKINR